jgi:hypothetical protein
VKYQGFQIGIAFYSAYGSSYEFVKPLATKQHSIPTIAPRHGVFRWYINGTAGRKHMVYVTKVLAYNYKITD